jgi:prepilin-type N-terminal cleavage/methylation domain-containing protein/prepilin-type processing-associated H-X9-DG protein
MVGPNTFGLRRRRGVEAARRIGRDSAAAQTGFANPGFTLIELLVVIAIVAVLASLLFPALSRAKQRAGAATCTNNLRQVAVGLALYCDTYQETFPAPGSASVYGPQPEDWIWWHPGRDVNQSAIVPYIARFNAALFRCPQDFWAAASREYRYSYSLTSYNLDAGVNPGLSSIVTIDRQVFVFRATQVKRPSDKIMLVDEDSGTIDDSRFAPDYGNQVAARHNGKAPVAFVDSHVRLVAPSFGAEETNVRPGL